MGKFYYIRNYFTGNFPFSFAPVQMKSEGFALLRMVEGSRELLDFRNPGNRVFGRGKIKMEYDHFIRGIRRPI